MSDFTIDFFELAFFAEACIPPSPIARAMFWQNLTKRYWSQMTEDYDNSVSTFFQATGARRSIVSDTSFTVLAISNIAAKALTAVMWQ